MAEAPKTPAERPELRAAAPHQGGPLGSSGAAPTSTGGKHTQSGKSDTSAAGGEATADKMPAPDKSAASEPSDADKSTGKHAAKPVESDSKPSEKGAVPTGGTGTVADDAKTGGIAAAAKESGSTTDRATATAAGKESGSTADGVKSAAGETAKTAEGGKGPGKDGDAGKPAAGKDSEAAKAAAGKDSEAAAGKGDTAKAADKADGAGKSASKDEAGKAAADAGKVGAGKRSLVRRSFGLVGRGGRGVAAWARRPSGRVILPSVVVIALIGLAGTAGVYLVPKALEAAPTPSATPTFGDGGAAPAPAASDPYGLGGLPPLGATTAVPGFSVAPTTDFGLPGATVTTTGVGGGVVNRPADALASWAQTAGTSAGIPVIAVQAYGYAQLVVEQTMPTCHLNWTTLAAIGKVASGHGSSNGAVLSVDGAAQPTIYGLPLDGQGGRLLVKDTDQGVLDQDTTYDREVGPMKLVPSTWQAFQVDADRNGVADINDIDDAALVAANHLCKDTKGGVRDLSRADSWWDAVLSYNGGTLKASAQKVFDAASAYGKNTRS